MVNLDSGWDSKSGFKDSLAFVTVGKLWSGRRDLNPGPLAPQARNINYLQTTFTENKRLSPTKFGRQLDAKAGKSRLWTPGGLHSFWQCPCSYARGCHPFSLDVWRRQQIVLYIGCPPNRKCWCGRESSGVSIHQADLARDDLSSIRKLAHEKRFKRIFFPPASTPRDRSALRILFR
jgi:hypothetical protein